MTGKGQGVSPCVEQVVTDNGRNEGLRKFASDPPMVGKEVGISPADVGPSVKRF